MSKVKVGELLYEITSKVSGKFTSDVKKTEKSFRNVARETDKAGESSQRLTEGYRRMRVSVLAVVGAIAGIALAIGRTIRAYNAQERAEVRLAQIATRVTGATQEQIKAYIELAKETQRIGVIGDEVQIQGLSQIASFAKQAETVTILNDSLADLAVANYGVSVSQEQMQQTANQLGRALDGNLGALTRTGILVSEDLKKAFEEASTEQERAGLLAQIVADNYGGLNEALRNTTEGRLKALSNRFSDLTERIGKAFIPALEEVVGSLENIDENTEKTDKAFTTFSETLFTTVNVTKAVIGSIRLIIESLILAGFTVTSFAKQWGASIGDIVRSIRQSTGAFNNFATGLFQITTGQFRKARESFSEGSQAIALDFSDTVKVIEERQATFEKTAERMRNTADNIRENWDRAQFLTGFQETNNIFDSVVGGLASTTENFDEKMDEASKGASELRQSIIDVAKEARNTAKALAEDLVKSIDEFNSAIQSNQEETIKGLAEITLKAEEQKNALQEALRTADGDEATRLRDELRDVQKVLDSKEQFEKRNAERILAIREQLTEAGIDPDSAGITALEEQRSLEEEIEEQRRIASLNEFERFEEQQALKLQTLVDNFISEVKLIEQKSLQVQSLEQETTDFLMTTNADRKDAVIDFVDTSILKYQEMESELKKLVELQKEFDEL